MARQPALRVVLPADWHETPAQGPREFRRKVRGAGVLQIALQPPLPELRREPKRLVRWLRDFIAAAPDGLNPIEQVKLVKCEAGPCAFCTCRSTRYGLVALWVIPADALVLGTYVMGSPSVFDAEFDDVMGIMQSAYLQDAGASRAEQVPVPKPAASKPPVTKPK